MTLKKAKFSLMGHRKYKTNENTGKLSNIEI